VYVGSLGDKQGAVVLRDELVQRLRKDHGIEVVPSPSEADAIITGTGEILLTGYKRPQCLHRAGARGFWCSMQRSTTKTDAGERIIIPLNATAWAAILELRERAKVLFGGEAQLHWFLFPHAPGFTKPDPTKPMSGWRTAWRQLTRAIHCPACGQLQQPAEICRNEQCKADLCNVRSPLHGLRFHDLRHHAITELAESQANDSIIREIAGHVSPKMLAHYSHVRMDTKRKALDALSAGGLIGGYDTKGDTNSQAQPTPKPQMIERIGGADGIRTH